MIYKRGKIYWYKFMWNGASIRESTKQGNDKVARQILGDHLKTGHTWSLQNRPYADLARNVFLG